MRGRRRPAPYTDRGGPVIVALVAAIVALAAVCGLQAVAIVALVRHRPVVPRAPSNSEDHTWEDTTGIKQMKGAIERLKGAA